MKKQKRQQGSPWKSPERKPVCEESDVIGVVWSVPSREEARAAILEIGEKKYQISPGS